MTAGGKSVAEYRDRAEWLEERKSGIGGSDAGAICGVDPHRNALEVYEEKIAVTIEDEPPNPDQLRGRLYEAIAVDLYVAETGRAVRRQPLSRHREHQFMVVSMDRQQLNDPRGPGYLEVKSPGIQVFRQLKDHGLPQRFILQMQHGLEVKDYEWGTFAIYDCLRPSVLYFDVERDREVGAFLVEQEGKFWQHVQERKPPSVDPIPMPNLVHVGGDVMVRDDPEWAAAALDLYAAKQLTEQAESLGEHTKDVLKTLMGQFGVFEGGGLKVHWKQYAGKVTFDRKALIKASPIDRDKLLACLSELAMRDVKGVDVIQNILRQEDVFLDLSRFEQRGDPFPKLTPYFLKSSEE